MAAIKTVVVSFRLSVEEMAKLNDSFEKQPMVGIRSPKMLARKLTLDWMTGKLAYENKRDMLLAPEVRSAKTPKATKAGA